MTLVTKYLAFVALVISLALYHPVWGNSLHTDQEKSQNESFKRIVYSDLLACKEPNRYWTESMPLNYLGPSLHVSGGRNLILCPGDFFGDPNSTYFVIKRCSIEMYHKGKLIWPIWEPYMGLFKVGFDEDFETISYGQISKDEPAPDDVCAFLLGEDGEVGLYSGGTDIYSTEKYVSNLWRSRTNFHPQRTELRAQGQQFQILQKFKDGNQRLFYFSGTNLNLREFQGEPKKIGSSGFVKNHTDQIPTILSIHEYIGDLEGLHLILEDNCELYLKDHYDIIWFFQPFWPGQSSCSLVIQGGKWISISNMNAQYEPHFSPFDPIGDLLKFSKPIPESPKKRYESLMIYHSFKVIESQFVLEDNQLFIIQTLEDGSKRTFETQPGKNYGLKLQKEFRQIAKNNITITRNEPSFTIERMDYIGNLTGLHLILQDDCTLLLANSSERLWQQKFDTNYSFMECFISFKLGQYPEFEGWHNHRRRSIDFLLLEFSGSGSSRQQLLLNNNNMIFTGEFAEKNFSEKYYAGPNTSGYWSRCLSEHSLIIRAQDRDNLKMPKKAHIGDFNRIYLTFEDNCNWVLYNRNQTLWESSTARSEIRFSCNLFFKTDGTLVMTYSKFIGYKEDDEYDKSRTYVEAFVLNDDGCNGECQTSLYEKGEMWSTETTTKNIDSLKELRTSELSIRNDWLWLTQTHQDGTVYHFKALKDTNNFIAAEFGSDISQ